MQQQSMKKETVNLKESKKEHMRVFGGREKGRNDVIRL